MVSIGKRILSKLCLLQSLAKKVVITDTGRVGIGEGVTSPTKKLEVTNTTSNDGILIKSSGNNYQAEKASEAIISGGFFGKGIGEGVLKNKVPEAHTDYIVSVISEEFGAIMIFFILSI